MRKIILASAAAFVMTAGAADAQMLLYEDANDSKVVVNQWAGQSFDPINRQVNSGTVREFAAERHALPIPQANRQANRPNRGASPNVRYQTGTPASFFRQDPFGD